MRIRHVRNKDKDCKSGYHDEIHLDGEIGADTAEVFKRLLPKLHQCYDEAGTRYVNNVYMNSRGGSLRHGMEIGKLLKEHVVSTRVTKGQRCSSACALAFLGGKYRNLIDDAELLFHAQYKYKQSFGFSPVPDCSDTGQVSELRTYYIRMLGRENGEFLLNRTMKYCSDKSGWVINASAAKLFNITTD